MKVNFEDCGGVSDGVAVGAVDLEKEVEDAEEPEEVLRRTVNGPTTSSFEKPTLEFTETVHSYVSPAVRFPNCTC